MVFTLIVSCAKNSKDIAEVIIEGCTIENSINYNPDATVDDESCIAIVLGCINETACNYNSQANTADGSCIEKPANTICNSTVAVCNPGYSGSLVLNSTKTAFIGKCELSTVVSGRVVDGPIKHAKIYVDANRNFQLDPLEAVPIGITNEQGRYATNFLTDIEPNTLLIAIGGIDTVTNIDEPTRMLFSEVISIGNTTSVYFSPLTSFLSATNKEDRAGLLQALNIQLDTTYANDTLEALAGFGLLGGASFEKGSDAIKIYEGFVKDKAGNSADLDDDKTVDTSKDYVIFSSVSEPSTKAIEASGTTAAIPVAYPTSEVAPQVKAFLAAASSDTANTY